jgi:serine-type D-Ala-D-Ala carboxypeptidase
MTVGDSSQSSLIGAFDNQDQQFAAAFTILQKAIADQAFPAASVAVTHHGKLIALRAFGHFTYDLHESAGHEKSAVAPPLSRPLRQGGNYSDRTLGAPFLPTFGRSGETIVPSTLFDIASLTKVVATTSMAILLYDRGLLDLDAPVSAVVPEFLADSTEDSRSKKDSRRKAVTLRMLLAHSSGLPAYEKLFLRAKSRKELLHATLTTPLTADPGSRAEYSDIGFLVLGVALERLAGGNEEAATLDRFCQREVFAPLAMANTCFNPPEEMRAHIPPTQDDRTFRHRIVQGEVQDENASILGGVAPHAGLFSTAGDLAQFAHAILGAGVSHACPELVEGCSPILRDVGSRIFRPETISLFTHRESSPTGTSRALGWDTPSSASQSGKYFPENSFGHLGYTGTSLWIDPARQLSITLLTNRTWPDCSNLAIKQVRPKFHDAIIEALA